MTSQSQPATFDLDVDLRFHVDIPTSNPAADAKRLEAFLHEHERDLALVAYRRREVPKKQRAEGAILSRPEALGSRSWAIGYTERRLLLRVDVPHFKQYIQRRVSFFRWETRDVPDHERQEEYGRKLTELVCRALDLQPTDLKTEAQIVP